MMDLMRSEQEGRQGERGRSEGKNKENNSERERQRDVLEGRV